MNRTKFTLTSSILAAALGLALGLAAAPAMADKPVEGVHGHDGDNGDELATPLDVIVNEVSGPDKEDLVCPGMAVPNSVLAVDIQHGCTISMPSITAWGDPDDRLSLFRVEVRTRKNVMTDIQLCFSTNETFSLGNNGDVYCADRLNATVCIESVEPTRIYLTPLMPAGWVKLRKLHQPFKGEFTDEEVLVGEFCYTAQDGGDLCDEARPNCPLP